MAWNEGSKRADKAFNRLEERITLLESDLKQKSLELSELQQLLNQDEESVEKFFASASRMVSTYRNRIASADEEVKLKVNTIDEFIDLLKKMCEESDEKLDHIKELSEGAAGSVTAIDDKFELLEDKIIESESVIEKTKTILENAKNTAQFIDQLENRVLAVEEMSAKSEALFQVFSKRKNEIDQFYFKYMGQEGDVGIAETVEKEAQELMDEYERLQQNLVELEDQAKERAHKFFSTTEIEKNSVLREIKKLLPSALTAGLSHAYEEKVTEEVKFQASMNKNFNWAVALLIIISTLPFLISALIDHGSLDFKSILNNSLQYLPLIIPMYFPVLWVAYSSNKRINLSKRLIEEYTHKGVLNKTFKGLSDQIDAIGDSDLTEELRTKLLFNLLSASSENPGKLISDYNSSDHPLMDALDKSAKLANSIEVLSKIPGFSKIVTKLDEKSKKILETQEKKVSAVLDDESDGKSTQ